MKRFEALNEEMKQTPKGVYAPYYYRAQGFRKWLAAPPATLRANGICALFTESRPVILKNELLAGNLHCLYTEAREIEVKYAKGLVDMILDRNFVTNKDHYAPDYSRILSRGVKGLLDEIAASEQAHQGDGERLLTLASMKATLEAFLTMIKNYAEAAEALIGTEGYDDAVLTAMAESCRVLLAGRPRGFRDAIQLVWFCHNAFLMEGRYAMALARLDQYLYPFYKADRESGRITDAEVIELLENMFIRLQNDVVNICIGGQDAAGNCQINPLSYCILRAVGNCNVPGPNLSLRYTLNTPDEFLDEALKIIGTGLGYPALMNDDINIAALKKYGYADEDVYNYCMVGCIENFITGKQPPWSDGRFDTPRFLDYVFNNGLSPTSGTIGLYTGEVEEIETMEEFMARYEKQLAYAADEAFANYRRINDGINQKYFPEPFLSCFCDDCIGRGLDINDGGAIYPNVHGFGIMGIGTVCDSLAAIEKVVFLDKKATLAELRDALNANFEGYDELRQLLLDAPKYGNNDDFVDKYAVWFLDYLSSCFRKYKTRLGGGIYVAAAANVSNIHAGKITGATPDGRLRYEPYSDAASPTYGRDTRGPTAVVQSVTKPDYTQVACGSVVNQKYSPSMFDDGKRAKLLALIKTYFKKGGQEIQINATSREVLKDAMEHPENYKSLVVRVSGFSAFYVTLARDVQLDILNRTQQE